MRQRYTASVEQVEAWGTVAAIIAGGGALHLGDSHVQTHTWTCTTLCLTFSCCHVHHPLWTRTWGSKHAGLKTHLKLMLLLYFSVLIAVAVVAGVPEQGWELQSLVWMCGPWHLLPPCSGEGELQKRSRS